MASRRVSSRPLVRLPGELYSSVDSKQDRRRLTHKLFILCIAPQHWGNVLCEWIRSTTTTVIYSSIHPLHHPPPESHFCQAVKHQSKHEIYSAVHHSLQSFSRYSIFTFLFLPSSATVGVRVSIATTLGTVIIVIIIIMPPDVILARDWLIAGARRSFYAIQLTCPVIETDRGQEDCGYR